MKAQTPLHLFRSDSIDEQKAQGRNPQVVSSEFWAEVREKWSGLSVERKELYNTRSEASLGIARQNRMARKGPYNKGTAGSIARPGTR